MSSSCAQEMDKRFTLQSDSLFLESYRPDLSDEDQLLKNVNLKYFSDNGQPIADWYSQIIRLSFGVFQPVSIELCRKEDGSKYDVIIKYPRGESVKFNNRFFNASKGVSSQFFKIQNNKQIDSIFYLTARMCLLPDNIPRSVFRHTFEYFSSGNNSQPCYVKCEIWGKPQQNKKTIAILTLIHNVAIQLLKQKKIDTAFLDEWTKNIEKWNAAN